MTGLTYCIGGVRTLIALIIWIATNAHQHHTLFDQLEHREDFW